MVYIYNSIQHNGDVSPESHCEKSELEVGCGAYTSPQSLSFIALVNILPVAVSMRSKRYGSFQITCTLFQSDFKRKTKVVTNF
jgi:hypothetical protein